MGRAARCSVSHGSAGLEGCSTAWPSCPALSRVCVQLAGRWYSIGLASNSNWFKDKKHLLKMCTTDIAVTADGNMEVTSTYPKYGWRGAAGPHAVLGAAGWALGLLSSTPPHSPADHSVLLSRGEQCEKRNSLYIRTEQPGRFSYTNPREPLGPQLNSAVGQWGSDGGGGGGPRLSAGLSGALSISAGWGSNHDIRVVETNYDEYALVATQISKSTGSSNMVLLYSTSSRCPCAAQTPRLSSEGICPAGGGHGTAPPGRVPLPWLPGAALTLLFPQAAPRRLHPSALRGSCSSPRSRA